MSSVFDPLNPLKGLENVPGINLGNQENYITQGKLMGGAKGLLQGIGQGYNPVLTLGLTGMGVVEGGRQSASDLANLAKTQQDIVKSGVDITKTGLEIQEKGFDFKNKQAARNALMLYINNLPIDQQILALTNPDEFSKTLIGQYAPTGSMKEYNFAVSQGYKGEYPDWIRDVEKYRATTFNMGTEGAYAKAAGEKGFEIDHEMVQQTYNMYNAAREGNVAARILASGKAYTGSLAPVQLSVEKLKAFLTNDGKLADSITATEVLAAMTGKQVFPMIGELGIGARGLDTPAERKFLQGVMTGDISNDPNALLKLNIMARRRQDAFAQRFNQKLKSGDLSKYEKARGKLSPMELPELVPIKQYQRGDRIYQVFNDGYGRFLDENGNVTDEKVTDKNGNVIDYVDPEYTFFKPAQQQ